MADKKQEEQWRQADEEVRKNLPPGIKLLRTLRGHTEFVGRIAWSPDGRILASPSDDKTIRLWDSETGECLRTLNGHKDHVNCVAFDLSSGTLVSCSSDQTIKLWDPTSGKLLRTLEGHVDDVLCVTFDPSGRILASASRDGTIKVWEPSGKLLRTVETFRDNDGDIFSNNVAFDPTGRIMAGGGSGQEDSVVKLWNVSDGTMICELKTDANSIAFDSAGQTLAITTMDSTITVWNGRTGRPQQIVEGPTDSLHDGRFSSDGQLFGAKEGNHGRNSGGSIKGVWLWRCDTWKQVALIPEAVTAFAFQGALAFNPRLPLLATVGSDRGATQEDDQTVIHVYELDLAVLLERARAPSVSYTSAKVVLVGDSGVGKTGLGWRLAHGEFKEHSSTHGQQFWLLKQLCKKRRDGAECEAVLWDLAGQPDYRLIHALFLDDADLALVLFDPTRNDDPLSGVEFWLKQLKVGTSDKIPTLLIAARSDRGTARLTQGELQAFCKQRGIRAYLSTSAKAGEGIEQLVERMRDLISWDEKPATVTTETFKRIKDLVLELKENRRRRKIILTTEGLRKQLEKADRRWKFTDAEMLTAVGHLANHGYVTRLKTSRGEPRILLAPELLNNLAASLVLEARRNVKGLGSLEEQKLLSGGYKFPELEKLSETEQAILLDSAAVLFLEHNVCFRETDLAGRAYLVFPELINLKRPTEEETKTLEDGAAYTVSGAVENVYASLVVLMGYTQTFTRTNQWRNHARYEVGNGQVCGFRLEEERAGELDFVLYFGNDTDAPVRMLFQSLFENFLARRNLTVRRFEPVACKNGHALNRAVVRQRISGGADFAFCSECGEKITLPKADQPVQLTRPQAEEVEANRRVADQRSRFEQVLFRLKTYVTEQKIVVPECFISYAWGNPEQERWVEKSLAPDLQKAGILVVLDRWENARIGSSVPRFVERVAKSGRVIVVGTPLYRKKYDNGESMRGFVVAAEGDLIGKRMIGTEAQKETVLPILLEGTEDSAFPHLLHGRVYADFRKSEKYFETALHLLLSLYQIKPQEPVAIELRESLGGRNAP